MKSVKPGRGPSMVDAAGSIIAAGFGVIWTVTALQMGAGILFALFGLCFVGIAIVQAIYNYKNATSENRYSEFDIVDAEKEPDPWNRSFAEKRGDKAPSQPAQQGGDIIHYCPYCGKSLGGDFKFCPDCGKELPK